MTKGFRKRVSGALQTIYNKRSWRRDGAAMLQIERAHINVLDRIADDAVFIVEEMVAGAMHARAAELRAEASKVEAAARAFAAESAMRRFELRTAEIEDYNEFVDEFTRAVLADMKQKGMVA
ncbi:hypothetical protein [Bradyrhizobium diazoefficiens]